MKIIFITGLVILMSCTPKKEAKLTISGSINSVNVDSEIKKIILTSSVNPFFKIKVLDTCNVSNKDRFNLNTDKEFDSTLFLFDSYDFEVTTLLINGNKRVLLDLVPSPTTISSRAPYQIQFKNANNENNIIYNNIKGAYYSFKNQAFNIDIKDYYQYLKPKRDSIFDQLQQQNIDSFASDYLKIYNEYCFLEGLLYSIFNNYPSNSSYPFIKDEIIDAINNLPYIENKVYFQLLEQIAWLIWNDKFKEITLPSNDFFNFIISMFTKDHLDIIICNYFKMLDEIFFLHSSTPLEQMVIEYQLDFYKKLKSENAYFEYCHNIASNIIGSQSLVP